MIEFLQDPNPWKWCFVFGGYAGVGKTFCMKEVERALRGSRIRIVYTAPTNKAAKVLRGVVGTACTIYSLLGLRVDKSGELKQVIAGKEPDLSDIDAVVVDEGSMINTNLRNICKVMAERYDVKFIFMGDPAQLPPVGERDSPIWSDGADVQLTKVMRHDNQILRLVTSIREQVESIAPSCNIRSDNDGSEGVWRMDRRSFKQSIFDAAVRGDFADGAAGKVVAWRNVRVGEYNDLIRSAIFGAEAVPGMYLQGDRIVATGPCERADEILLNTDDEAIVEQAINCKHPIEPKYNCIELKCRTELNKVIRLLVLHPSSKQQFDNDGQEIAHLARANPKLWKKFWEHQDLVHQVKYAYALTAHRAQGSTYENVWVDSSDVLYNRNRREAFQCLYVACSRPTTRLFVSVG